MYLYICLYVCRDREFLSQRGASGEPGRLERRWSLWPTTPSIIAKSYTTYLPLFLSPFPSSFFHSFLSLHPLLFPLDCSFSLSLSFHSIRISMLHANVAHVHVIRNRYEGAQTTSNSMVAPSVLRHLLLFLSSQSCWLCKSFFSNIFFPFARSSLSRLLQRFSLRFSLLFAIMLFLTGGFFTPSHTCVQHWRKDFTEGDSHADA